MSVIEALVASVVQTSHLTTLLHHLIGIYFTQLSTVLIVHNSSHRGDLKEEYFNGVQLAFKNQRAFDREISLLWMDVVEMSEEDFEDKMLNFLSLPIEGFITILPSTLPFLHARYYGTRMANLRFKDKFYLFLCDGQENPWDFLATEILQFYPSHLMVRPQTNHLGKSETSSQLRDINFELWTQKFVGASGNLDAILLDAFLPNETFVRNVELYPDKLRNLEDRAVKVGSHTYMPYTVTNYVAAGTGNVDPINEEEWNNSISFHGSEAELVIEFCRVLNCHLRVRPYGMENWGAIYDNETSFGLLGELYEQKTEFTIGCIYNWYNEITETSHTIAHSSVTILGPAPVLTPPFYTIIAPFSTRLWLFVVFTMFVSSIALYLIRLHGSRADKAKKSTVENHIRIFDHAFLDVFAIFLQQPSGPTGLKRFAARIFLTLVLGATITLENTYSGQLKSILTVPLYTEPIDTTEKWSKTKWFWGAKSKIWIDTIEFSSLELDQKLISSFQILEYDVLYNYSFRDDFGLAIERLQSGTVSIGKYITRPAVERKIILKDDIYFDYTRGVSIRGWPLMPLFNKHVRTCIESGLFDQWERQYVAHYFDRKSVDLILNSAYGHKEKPPPQKLTIVNITGAIFALFLGLIMASIAFLLEIFNNTLKRRFSKWNRNFQ